MGSLVATNTDCSHIAHIVRDGTQNPLLLLLLLPPASQAFCHLQGLPAGWSVLVRCAFHNGNIYGPGRTRNGELPGWPVTL
jgi:hypothetical protein